HRPRSERVSRPRRVRSPPPAVLDAGVRPRCPCLPGRGAGPARARGRAQHADRSVPVDAADRRHAGVPAQPAAARHGIAAGRAGGLTRRTARKVAGLRARTGPSFCDPQPESQMYTGIVQALVPVVHVDSKPGLKTYAVELPDALTSGLKLGASVS